MESKVTFTFDKKIARNPFLIKEDIKLSETSSVYRDAISNLAKIIEPALAAESIWTVKLFML